ncbi:MAG: DUF4440 domain-containing protein [Ignavibacteria bacterium]|nr:DUF4440 domain-containing protein [Ignavibacteria bacterium]
MNKSHSKYDFLKNKTCPYCQSRIKNGADFTVCSHCGVPHHKECWEENKGCTTYGCINNPHTEKKIEINSALPEDVGDLSPEEIRESLLNPESVFIQCRNCKSEVEESSVYCKYCGYNLKDNNVTGTVNEASDDFKKDFSRRYEQKVRLTRKRFYITLGSFLIIITAVAYLFYSGITKLNAYFSSDEYLIKSTIENWKKAWEKEDIDKYRSYMTDDYEYFGKDGKRIDLRERLKRIEWTFKNYSDIKIDFKDYKFISDSSVTENDRKVIFNQIYESDKFQEKGVKTLRLYRGDETKYEWKIYREFFEKN